MATVTARLRMFDMMTQPLQQVTQALNLTVSAMDDINNSANKDMKITNTLNTARDSIARAGAGLQELANSQDKAANIQNKLNNSFNRGSSAAGGLMGKVKGLIGAYLGFQAIKKGIDLTIGGAARLEQQLITISGMLGNKDVGKAFFAGISKYANESVYGLKEFNTITRSFIQFTKNTDKLMDLNKTAEKLAFLDPTQGLEGAGFALKEAMGGDFMSLKQRFGFGKVDAEILKASKSMDDFINKFNKLLAQKGATDKALQEFNQSAVAQMNNLKSNIETAFSQAATRGLEILKPLLTKINEGFKNGSFQSFFDKLSIGLTFVVELTMKVIDGFQWVGTVVSDNWGIIEPIIWGIVTALGAYNLALLAHKGHMLIVNGLKLISTVQEYKQAQAILVNTAAYEAETIATAEATVAQAGFNTVLLACPLTWIIISIIAIIVAIYAVIGAINKITGKTISATGVICGAISAAGAFVWDLFLGLLELVFGIINLMINPFITFANFLGNIFINPISSIVYLFQGMGDTVLGILQTITSAIDFVLGTDWSSSIQGWRNDLKSAADNIVKEYAPNENYKKVMEELNLNVDDLPFKRVEYGSAYDKGYKFGADLSDKFNIDNLFGDLGSKLPKTSNLNEWNKMQGPGQLSAGLNDANKHLKGINDKIDVSNEHLEMLRDLAEEKSISNFTTLTPTISFGNVEVKEEADINKIISKIESYMENELANSAEGVYA